MSGFDTPQLEAGDHRAVMEKSVYGPAGVKPNYQYKNDSGQFTFHELVGDAIYKFVDGNFFSDKLSFIGHARVGKPDDDFNHIGFDAGYIYKVQGEEFYFLFADIGFPHPDFGYEIFRLYTSEDGKAWNRWKTPSGTTRIAIPALPPPPPPPPPPSSPPPPPPPGQNPPGTVTQDILKKVKNALEQVLKPLAVGNEGSVDVDLSLKDYHTIHFKATIKQRQVAAGFVIYSASETAEGDLDALNLQSVKDTKICVKLPSALGGDKACVTVAEIAEILATIA